MAGWDARPHSREKREMTPDRKERRILSPRLLCWGLGMIGLAIVISIMTGSAANHWFAVSSIAAPALTTSTAGLTLQAIPDQAPNQTTQAA